MRKEDAFCLGKIAKKFSFKGEILLYLDTDEPYQYKKLESIFVEFGSDLIPFFIEYSSYHKNNFLRIKLEDINSEEQADKIIGKKVFLPLDMLPILDENKFYFHEIIGFTAQDIHHGTIGVITDINDHKTQAFFVIIGKEKKEILIPMVDQFIEKIDKKQKIITLKTPPGLIELYIY